MRNFFAVLSVGFSVAISGIAYSKFLAESPEKKRAAYEKMPKPPGNRDESVVAFHTMMDALTHARCVNCHPSDGKHIRLGGATNLGIEEKACNTCHQNTNNLYSGVPGAPEWAMAPESMAWQGLNRYQIAEKMMDPELNGNRTPDDIMHHLTEHELVLWAWEPGIRPDGTEREKPPVSKEEYIKAVKKWIAAGAVVPEPEN